MDDAPIRKRRPPKAPAPAKRRAKAATGAKAKTGAKAPAAPKPRPDKKTRRRFGKLPIPDARADLYWGINQPELRDITDGQLTALVLDSSEFAAVLGPKLDRIDARSRTGAGARRGGRCAGRRGRSKPSSSTGVSPGSEPSSAPASASSSTARRKGSSASPPSPRKRR